MKEVVLNVVIMLLYKMRMKDHVRVILITFLVQMNLITAWLVIIHGDY